MVKSRKRRVVRSLTRIHAAPQNGQGGGGVLNRQAISIAVFVTLTPVTATEGKPNKSA